MERKLSEQMPLHKVVEEEPEEHYSDQLETHVVRSPPKQVKELMLYEIFAAIKSRVKEINHQISLARALNLNLNI